MLRSSACAHGVLLRGALPVASSANKAEGLSTPTKPKSLSPPPNGLPPVAADPVEGGVEASPYQRLLVTEKNTLLDPSSPAQVQTLLAQQPDVSDGAPSVRERLSKKIGF